MSTLELPHTPGCLVCGPGNPYGMQLSSHVDPATGIVTLPFKAEAHQIGFEGIVHGGMLATVVDEAMVWAATWNQRRFCVCGELSVRFRSPVSVGMKLNVEARVEYSRPKLVQVAATVRTANGAIVAAGEGKYVPMSAEQSERVMRTLIDDPSTHAAVAMLTRGLAMES
ncbi:MAG: PaaI family thioesterase [Tepidisphaeraceae bacterium]